MNKAFNLKAKNVLECSSYPRNCRAVDKQVSGVLVLTDVRALNVTAALSVAKKEWNKAKIVRKHRR